MFIIRLILSRYEYCDLLLGVIFYKIFNYIGIAKRKKNFDIAAFYVYSSNNI